MKTRTVALLAFGPIHPTCHTELSYQRRGDIWRILDNSTGSAVGPFYQTKAELLSDLERYTAVFGCKGA